jgi:asparagine synthase (glutamine-hydrolysing)
MCGIYGGTIFYGEEEIQSKLKRTSFRGPDKMGWKIFNSRNNPVILGHNRLSIVDLDARSNQPFTYVNKIHIAFNGEVYNFKIIKKTLLKLGYEFKTTSDTEVVCAAYLEYGKDCVNHFNGMFAFVIYDEEKQLFFGARDRLGQKPFYYYYDGEAIEFSSQVSSIQTHHSNLSVSNEAISYYLAWGSVPDTYSIFNEIKKLSPGNYFIFHMETKALEIKQYWDIDYDNEKQFKGTYQEAKQELNILLKDAVSLRLFADVPVGVFLSGGVDSSIIAALATKSTSSKVKTFSVKFNEKGFDESVYAQQVADHLQTDHHVIECNYNEGIDLIDNFSYYYDEPFADSSAIPSMLLAKYTRQKVTVALSGDGGDESFIGYHRYNWIKRGDRAFIIPHKIRILISKIMRLAPNYRVKILADALKHKDTNSIYLASMTGVNMSWLNSKHDYLNIAERKYIEHTNKNLFERVSDFDIKTYLNWDINTKVDRATMAYSLEARAPLMDYRVVDFARSLPTSFKMKGKNQKRILKDVLYEYAPRQIFDRPKAGFTMPFSEWFKDELKDYVLAELSDENLKNIPNIDVREVSFMIKQHMEGSWNRYPLIWKLLVLKQWLDKNGKGLSIN